MYIYVFIEFYLGLYLQLVQVSYRLTLIITPIMTFLYFVICKFHNFYFSQIFVIHEICENYQHVKITRSTVYK